MLVLTNKAPGVDCRGTNTLVFKAQREGRAFVQRGGKHTWKACVKKNCIDYRKKGKHTKKETKKKPRFQNNWCWLLENGLRWLVKTLTDMLLCTGCVFSQKWQPLCHRCYSRKLFKSDVTEENASLLRLSILKSLPLHIALFLFYPFFPFLTLSNATRLLFTLCQHDLWNPQSR